MPVRLLQILPKKISAPNLTECSGDSRDIEVFWLLSRDAHRNNYKFDFSKLHAVTFGAEAFWAVAAVACPKYLTPSRFLEPFSKFFDMNF